MNFKKNFNTMTWVLIPVAIAINVVVGQIVLTLKLPVFLDSIGTVLVGVLAGPWAGALTGLLTSIISGLAINPDSFNWWPVGLFIGFIAGLTAQFGLFRKSWTVVVSGFIIAITSALLSAPIQILAYGGISPWGISFIVSYFMKLNFTTEQSVVLANFISEPIDKIATALLAYSIIQGLSTRFLGRFSQNDLVDKDRRGKLTNIISAGIIIFLLLVLAFKLLSIIPE